MTVPSPSVVQSTTRIVYSIDGLSGDLKVYWSKWISYFFSTVLRPAQIQQHEIQAAAHPVKDLTNIPESIDGLTLQDQIWIAASLRQLASVAVLRNDWVAQRNILQMIERVTIGLDEKEVSARHGLLAEEFEQFQHRKIFSVN